MSGNICPHTLLNILLPLNSNSTIIFSLATRLGLCVVGRAPERKLCFGQAIPVTANNIPGKHKPQRNWFTLGAQWKLCAQGTLNHCSMYGTPNGFTSQDRKTIITYKGYAAKNLCLAGSASTFWNCGCRNGNYGGGVKVYRQCHGQGHSCF